MMNRASTCPTLDLFSSPSVRIARVEGDDVLRQSDVFADLSQRLVSHESYYPGIKTWLKTKVSSGIRSGERVGYVGYFDNTPILAGVIKRGISTKFCHLSIDSGFQGNQLGSLMFALMVAEVRKDAQRIHFTLPEGLWQREKHFFESFGFPIAEATTQQYRMFEDELRCSADWVKVWRRVVARLPQLLTSNAIAGFTAHDGLVLSIAKPLAEAVMRGEKTVEIRRQFSTRWSGHSAGVYGSSGTGELLGVIRIDDVVEGSTEEVWATYGNRIGCSKAEYDRYTENRDRIFALLLSDPKPYEAPVPISQLAYLTGERLAAPQSYARAAAGNEWGRALSVAALLHGRTTSR
jgi:predicted transcriptional regulator